MTHPTVIAMLLPAIRSMNLTLGAVWTLGGLLSLLTAAPVVAEQDLLTRAQARFSPLPNDFSTPTIPLSEAQITLGRQLFFDKRLSRDGQVSCETCHLPGLHATDGRAKAVGVDNRINARNAPTLLNTALQFRIHWDGARESVEEQATKSLIGPSTFGNPDFAAVVTKLRDLGYEPAFRRAFPGEADPIRPENWGKAIGNYERTLVSPSPFDAFLKGQISALNETAQRGLETFLKVGCANCHDGVGLGGNRYQKFGLFSDYASLTGASPPDEGRLTVTQNPADRFVFKVPPLRNVAMTPPYFHDGSVDTLAEAIRIMGRLQLNLVLADDQIRDLEVFLESLTGPIPVQFKAPPP